MNEELMDLAYRQAEIAYKKKEIPVGAVIVKNGKIIAKAYNKREKNNDATAHAEIIAIKKANKKLKAWRLNDCEMYITLEPCPMCAGAIINSRIKKIYIGTMDEKNGACGSVRNLLDDYSQNYRVEIEKNINQKKCEKILKDFFKDLRRKKLNN